MYDSTGTLCPASLIKVLIHGNWCGGREGGMEGGGVLVRTRWSAHLYWLLGVHGECFLL